MAARGLLSAQGFLGVPWKVLALPPQLLAAVADLEECVVGVFQVLFPGLPYLAEAVPVVALALVQGVKKLLVHFGLQLLGKALKEPQVFGTENADLFEIAASSHDGRKGEVQTVESVINIQFFGNVVGFGFGFC
jgi:hypothetical protein